MEVFEHHYCWALNEWRTMGRQKRGSLNSWPAQSLRIKRVIQPTTLDNSICWRQCIGTCSGHVGQTFPRSLQPPSNKASKLQKLKQFLTRGANQTTKRLTIRSPPHRIASTVDSDVGLRSGSTCREAHQRWRIMAFMFGRG
jgi:hypothetical protein